MGRHDRRNAHSNPWFDCLPSTRIAANCPVNSGQHMLRKRLRMEHPTAGREFDRWQMSAAHAYIQAMPRDVRKIHVDVFEDGWRFVYGDRRAYVPVVLELVVQGRAFRVRGLTDQDESRF